jgi:hypothetical protein
MIVPFLVYDPATGAILSTGYCSEKDVLLQGQHVLSAVCNQLTQYVVNGQIVDLPPRPSGAHWIFDFAVHEWKRDLQILEIEIKQQRNQALLQSDWTQLPDVPLETKAAWATYRQELRDITEQPGFPDNVIWPTPPQ